MQLNSINHLQSAFDECLSYTRYHPSKGYWWDFKDNEDRSKRSEKKDETSSAFQRQRVDMLLSEISKKFPLPLRAVQQLAIQQSDALISKPASTTSNNGGRFLVFFCIVHEIVEAVILISF